MSLCIRYVMYVRVHTVIHCNKTVCGAVMRSCPSKALSYNVLCTVYLSFLLFHCTVRTSSYVCNDSVFSCQTKQHARRKKKPYLVPLGWTNNPRSLTATMFDVHSCLHVLLPFSQYTGVSARTDTFRPSVTYSNFSVRNN